MPTSLPFGNSLSEIFAELPRRISTKPVLAYAEVASTLGGRFG